MNKNMGQKRLCTESPSGAIEKLTLFVVLYNLFPTQELFCSETICLYQTKELKKTR